MKRQGFNGKKLNVSQHLSSLSLPSTNDDTHTAINTALISVSQVLTAATYNQTWHSLIWLDVQIIRSTSIQRTLANREYTLNNNGENDSTNKTKCVSNLASAGVGDLFVTTWIFKFKKQKNNPEL